MRERFMITSVFKLSQQTLISAFIQVLNKYLFFMLLDYRLKVFFSQRKIFSKRFSNHCHLPATKKPITL